MPYDLTLTVSTLIAVTGRRTGEGVDETRSLHATTRAAWSSDPFPGPAARDRAESAETR